MKKLCLLLVLFALVSCATDLKKEALKSSCVAYLNSKNEKAKAKKTDEQISKSCDCVKDYAAAENKEQLANKAIEQYLLKCK